MGILEWDLFDKLAEAKDGIFTWAVLGLNSLLSQNAFRVGDKVMEDNAEFVKSLNPAMEFFEEELEFDSEYRVGSTALYMRYTEWCKKFRHRPLGRMKFNDQLSKNYPEVEKRQSGSDRRISFFGVRFKEGILGG